MGKPSHAFRLVGLVACAAAVPFPLGQCSGDRAGIAIEGDAQSDVNGSRGVNADGSSGGSDATGDGHGGANGSGASSSGAGGGGTSSGGGRGGGGTAKDSGQGGGADGANSGNGGGQDAGTLCTSLGNPPGCVLCLGDKDCPTTASHCLAGTCVTCVTSADCGTGSTPVCWPGDNTCHTACGDGGAACPTGPGQPSLCDPSTGACVGCMTASDCPTAAPICDATTKQCVQCQTNSDCSGTTPHCDPSTQTCVACSANADCTDPSSPICRYVPPAGRGMPPMRACQPGCINNSQCADAAGPVCDSNGYCVQCVDNSLCSGATPVCNTNPYPFATYESCVACLPPPFGSDAGSQGCDGGACVLIGRGPAAGYMCQ